jgi:hypothetical protein
MELRQIGSMLLAAAAVCVMHYTIVLAVELVFWTRYDPQPWEEYQYLLVAIEFVVYMVWEIAMGIVPVVAILAVTRARLRPWRAVPALVAGALIGTIPFLAFPSRVNGWVAIGLAVVGLWLAGYIYERRAAVR